MRPLRIRCVVRYASIEVHYASVIKVPDVSVKVPYASVMRPLKSAMRPLNLKKLGATAATGQSLVFWPEPRLHQTTRLSSDD